MKKAYEIPEVKAVLFRDEDVIRTSGPYSDYGPGSVEGEDREE